MTTTDGDGMDTFGPLRDVLDRPAMGVDFDESDFSKALGAAQDNNGST